MIREVEPGRMLPAAESALGASGAAHIAAEGMAQ
jgi:glycosyltransferase A (GT-A) superfamily protein (DUF2064 family)